MGKRKDDRPAPMRQTRKSLYILDKVSVVSDNDIVKNRVIEEALSSEYPLFSEMYDKDNSK